MLALVDLSQIRTKPLNGAVAQLDDALAAGQITIAIWAELLKALADPQSASNDVL